MQLRAGVREALKNSDARLRVKDIDKFHDSLWVSC